MIHEGACSFICSLAMLLSIAMPCCANSKVDEKQTATQPRLKCTTSPSCHASQLTYPAASAAEETSAV